MEFYRKSIFCQKLFSGEIANASKKLAFFL